LKKPFRRGAPIDIHRFNRWITTFGTYRDTVATIQIDGWLNQFKTLDRDLAARILDSVEFVSHSQIRNGYFSTLNSIPGWNQDPTKRKGKWRFVAFSSSSGESGDSMLHSFRQANGLSGARYNDLFILKSNLVNERLGPDDSVVFVDDFAGTGTQACKTWENDIQELIAGDSNAYLVLAACNIQARKRIESETDLLVYSHTELSDKDNIFSYKCRHFNTKERHNLLRYCKIANRKYPKGYGECGLIIVLVHNCPNNSIPVLHAYHPKWRGLFRRYD